MEVFLMHVGYNNAVDIDYTVTRRRSFVEIAAGLAPSAPERPYFATDSQLRTVFPSGMFNCWGVPSGAERSFAKTAVGDLVLIVPHTGIHDGGIRQIGIVQAKCPIRCYAASRLLWPATPDNRLFPLIFFFDTEVGFRSWFDFLEDVGMSSNWQPRGWYRRVALERFSPWGGPQGYLAFLRNDCHFVPLPTAQAK